MKKVASLIGIAVLATATTLAVAGGDFCQNKFDDGQGRHGAHAQHGEGHFKHRKMCQRCDDSNKHAMHKNVSPEKRQALMALKVENRIERMTQKLDLTAEQQAKVRQILIDSQQQMQRLRQEQRAAISKILTHEQAKKRQAVQAPNT